MKNENANIIDSTSLFSIYLVEIIELNNFCFHASIDGQGMGIFRLAFNTAKFAFCRGIESSVMST